MPVFVGQNHVPEYDPPPPPLTKEEQEKVDYEAYNERQRLKFEIPPPQWKGKYRPKTTPKYEYVSVVPHYPTQPHTREETEQRPLTEDEVRLYKRLQEEKDKQLQEEKLKQLNPSYRLKIQKLQGNLSFVPRETLRDFHVEIPKMLAPGEFLQALPNGGHAEWPNGANPLNMFRVARKIEKYSYPETDFQYTPQWEPGSLDICYRYNKDENRVLQEFAEQGWELVSCVRVNNFNTFYFKRELELIPDTTNAD
jgi:hypothetical protein